MENTSYGHPLDVLKRFMPAPLRTVFYLGNAMVEVETNDSGLVRPFAELMTDAPSSLFPTCRWKLLRDPDVLEKIGEITVIADKHLVIVSMGPACMIGVDLERKELMAFLGNGVEEGKYENLVAPLLMRLTEFSMCEKAAETSSCLHTVLAGRSLYA